MMADVCLVVRYSFMQRVCTYSVHPNLVMYRDIISRRFYSFLLCQFVPNDHAAKVDGST